MWDVVQICAPVFGLAFLGYAATRIGWFNDQAAEGLAKFVFNWATPFLMVRILSTQDLPAEFPWPLLLSFYAPVGSLYVLALFVSANVFGRNSAARVIYAMSTSFGNTVLVGLPLVLLAYDGAGALPYFILMSVHSLLLFTATALLLEHARQRNCTEGGFYSNLLTSLISNPVLIGAMLGLVLNYLGLALPGALDQMAQYLQEAVPACALFALGASLTRYRIVGRLPEVYSAVLAKNLLLPILVWVCARFVFGLGPEQILAAVLMAALPTGIHVYVFAERYGSAQRLATTTVFVSTVAGVFTLTGLLAWMGRLFS